MYFIPRNNKFYSFIAHLHFLSRYLLTLLAVSSILILWLLLVYFPISTHIDQSFLKLAQLRNQCKQIDKAKRKCQRLEQSLYLANPQNKKLLRNSFQSNLLFILEQAKKNELLLNKYTMDKKSNNKWVIQHSSEFIFTGNLSQITNFLQQLKKTDFPCESDYFLLKKIDTNSFRAIIKLDIIECKEKDKPLQLGTS
ncbi:MAG: hypothetical protein WCD44_03600 [Candidatus Babeliales bacterium]|jgi:hypothetical protein